MKINYLIQTTLFFMLFNNINFAAATPGLFDRPDFFEKGQEQFEKEILRFEKEENIPSSNLNNENLPWSRIIIQTSGFTLKMPPGNITQELEVVETPEGNIQFNILASHPSASRYVIAYSEEVASERFQDSETILAEATNSIAQNNVGLAIIFDQDINLDDNPGKEFQLKNQEEVIFFRLILVKQRLYVLAVNQKNNNLSKDLVDRFFNSFELFELNE